MSDETDPLLDATTSAVPALLTAMDALSHLGRHLHPPDLPGLVGEVAPFQPPLAEGRERFGAADWPEHLHHFRDQVLAASDFCLEAFAALEECLSQANPVLGAYRALGFNTRAVETMYPVAFMLPPVSRFFLADAHRQDAALAARLDGTGLGREDTGILHAGNAATERGGFSLYVPEHYTPDSAMPLVVALHGGSGHGRSFLWSWLRDARSRGVILASPTSREGTWSLMGPDADSANLDAIVSFVGERYHVDTSRVLLTGMSDGGTFSYVSGLREDAPFTHLAPIAASFHPMLLEMTTRERLLDLPVYLVHGALDWMFPVDIARSARDALHAAGTDLVYREIDDLSHTYPREENDRMLDWLLA